MKLQTPKGFKDYLPQEALRREFVLSKIKEVFKKFGFEPLETPTLEYAETLKGKYGEEEKLIYEFITKGGDEVALKYDLTVPLARVVAQYGPNGEQKLTFPFKRYQIQSAFRGENTQKGRYREFLQCDADIVGVSSPLADAEILAMMVDIYESLGLDVIVKINDRQNLADIEPKYLAAIDKLGKIGEGNVLMELQDKGLSSQEAITTLNKVQTLKPTQRLDEIKLELGRLNSYYLKKVQFDPTLVRGLDYYTGLILEVCLKSNPNSSALGSGGRYDNLIGKFTGAEIPAVGCSVGLDRTIEAMEEAGLLDSLSSTQVLVTVFSEELADSSIEMASTLRANDISTQLWLDTETRLDKQLKYADQKGIPYALIIGPDEAKNNQVTVKDLKNQTQETLSVDEALQKLSS